MIESAHFIQFIAFGLGLLSIYICYNLKKERTDKFLLIYQQILIGINTIIFIHVLEAFLKIVLTEDTYLSKIKPSLVFIILVIIAIRLIISLRFLEISLLLKKRNLPKWAQYLLIPLLLLTSIVLFDNSFGNFHNILFNTIHLILSISIIWLGLTVFQSRNRESSLLKHKYTFGISVFFISYGILYLVLRASKLFISSFSDDSQMLGIGLLDLLFNLLNILFLKKTIRSELPKTKKETFNYLFSKHNISKREKDIIKLLCQGKTNKEIGEILFISPVTVRDHTSKIYAKTNTKNRVQLTNLFLSK